MTEELKITPQDLPRTPCQREEEMGRLEAMEEGLLMPGAASTSMVQADTQSTYLLYIANPLKVQQNILKRSKMFYFDKKESKIIL